MKGILLMVLTLAPLYGRITSEDAEFIVGYMDRCYKYAQAREQGKDEIEANSEILKKNNYKSLDTHDETTRWIAMYSSLCEENKDVDIDSRDLFRDDEDIDHVKKRHQHWKCFDIAWAIGQILTGHKYGAKPIPEDSAARLEETWINIKKQQKKSVISHQ